MNRLPRLTDHAELPEFRVETSDRITVADTDLSGIIYFDRYYRRAEIGFLELARKAGAGIREMFDERFVTPAVSSRCDYFNSVRVDDLVRQITFISHTGTSSQTSEHHFLKEDGSQAATVQIVRAVIDAETRRKASIEQVLNETPDSNLAKLLGAGIRS